MHDIYSLSHMHTYRIRDRGSRVRGDRGAAGAVEQAEPEIRENPTQGPIEPITKQQPEGKPRCITQ